MKLYAILLLCAFVCFVKCDSDSEEEKVREVAAKCKEENHASDEDVQAMFEKKPATTTAEKCLRACVMKHLGIMGDDGKLLKDGAAALAKHVCNGNAEEEALIEGVIDACVDLEVSEDHCEAAEEYAECMMKAKTAE